MRLIQPILSSGAPPRELAASLVAWLDRSRPPALFDDGGPWNYGICRKRLLEYAESWIEAGYQLDRWKWRETFAEKIRWAAIEFWQYGSSQVRTTIIFRKPGPTTTTAAKIPELQRAVPTPRNDAFAIRGERNRFSNLALGAGVQDMHLQVFIQIPDVSLSRPRDRRQCATIVGERKLDDPLPGQQEAILGLTRANVFKLDAFIEAAGDERLTVRGK